MQHITPIVCLCSANVGEHLSAVESELHAINKELKPLEQVQYLYTHYPLYDADSAMIYDFFVKNPNAIHLFHYAGHANGEKIQLKSGGRAKGLKDLFALQKNLALVFLNGCNSILFIILIIILMI
jgi:hypothetical protein